MNDLTTTARLRHEFAALKNYLIAAQDVVQSGHMPDMSGLENRVALLCEAVQKAEPDVQKECLPELINLLDYLAACEKSIRATVKPGEGETQ